MIICNLCKCEPIVKDIYDREVYKYFDKHELIDFVLESRKKGHLLDDYYNASDILKAIYRELE